MRETVIVVRDDIDGSKAAETVAFSLDGKDYLIDLSAVHIEELRRQFEFWIGHARRDRTRGRTSGSRPVNGVQSESTEVRAWAREQGIEVSQRGKVSAELIERYRAAQLAAD